MKNQFLSAMLCLILLIGSMSSYAIQTYSYNRPTYYRDTTAQYDYRPNYEGYGMQYVSASAFGRGSQPYYVANYERNTNPVAMRSSRSCNVLLGCRNTFDSHMYIDNALDWTYYNNPELLAPRFMQNNQRYSRGIYPQAFY